jgi:hypothetical protein
MVYHRRGWEEGFLGAEDKVFFEKSASPMAGRGGQHVRAIDVEAANLQRDSPL